MPYIGNSPANNVRGRFYYTASASQTLFSGADSNGKTLAYQDGGYVDVYLNGVLLQDTIDYTATTKTSINLVSGATAGDLVEIVAYGIFSVADTVSALSGGTFEGNVAIEADLTVDTNTLYVDSTNNRVGIGTASPVSKLSIQSPSGQNALLEIAANGNTLGSTSALYGQDAVGNAYAWQRLNGPLLFGTNNSERARINSSGAVLVGTTDDSVYNNSGSGTGINLQNFGNIAVARDGNDCMVLNRLNSDGSIALFNKDGSSVGSIASGSGRLAIGDRSASLRFVDASQKRISPYNITSLSDYDGLTDLGESGSRFQDIFATNGTIQTSDANEKQQIALLTDDEITAAKAISKLFKTFKWNSAVEAKGDAARTHTGVIAQEVQQVMTDAGLDAGNYAFFIRGVWWETQTEVPAVAEELDEDGNVITEAKEAYTRTETYDTAEEAPEGATERTRLGIRYPELLAFIGAATEQRLASIEARLDALETA